MLICHVRGCLHAHTPAPCASCVVTKSCQILFFINFISKNRISHSLQTNYEGFSSFRIIKRLINDLTCRDKNICIVFTMIIIIYNNRNILTTHKKRFVDVIYCCTVLRINKFWSLLNKQDPLISVSEIS